MHPPERPSYLAFTFERAFGFPIRTHSVGDFNLMARAVYYGSWRRLDGAYPYEVEAALEAGVADRMTRIHLVDARVRLERLGG